jgi:hypothetical protein
MSTPEERRENDLKVNFLIEKACGNDLDAKEYMEQLSFLARIVDDIADDFDTCTQNKLLAVVEILFVRMPSNKFYKKHQDILFSQHIAMWNAWEASNILNDGDVIDRIYAHVLRDYINETFPIVALLTQGHDKMKEINGSIRFLFKKNLGE